MAKIIKVGSNNPTFTSQNIANPAKTSRNGNHTNPFQFSNFEGNTLQFADVFEGFDAKKSNNVSFKGNKLRMIASSVTGSMNKMRTGISESIINFVNRVRGGISSAWNYAKNTDFIDAMNTPIEIPGLKGLSDNMSKGLNSLKDNVHGIGDVMSSSTIGKGIMSGINYLNKDALEVGKDISTILNKDVTTDLGKGIAEKWSALVARVHKNDLSTLSPSELEQRWIAINNSIAESEAA